MQNNGFPISNSDTTYFLLAHTITQSMFMIMMKIQATLKENIDPYKSILHTSLT